MDSLTPRVEVKVTARLALSCCHELHVCFYEDASGKLPRFKAYCQRCKLESRWLGSMVLAESSLDLRRPK